MPKYRKSSVTKSDPFCIYIEKRLPLIDYIEAALGGGTLLSGITLFVGAKLVLSDELLPLH